MNRLVGYLRSPQWHRQHRWRTAVWQAMGRAGLTGLHSLPMHRSWVEFAVCPMPLRHLDPACDGMKLVQISDLHYSPFVWRSYLQQHVQWINEMSPGVVVVTGDLFMGGYRYADRVAELLARLKAKWGVVCIMGNHDYGLSGGDRSLRGLRRAEYLEKCLRARGLIVLRNQVWTLRTSASARPLHFVGLDDEWAGRMDPKAAFAGVPANEATICLLHNPAHILQMMDYSWQWMLAGHTHGRQLAQNPVGQALYPGKYRHYTHGLYTINGRNLYVNRGLSYGQRAHEWCRPEITVFQLSQAAQVRPARSA